MRSRFGATLLALVAFYIAGDSAGARAADVNLLSFESGTVVRSYSGGIADPALVSEGGASLEAGAKGPILLVFELPGVATFSRMTVAPQSTDEGAPSATIAIAVSTTSAIAGFKDVGSVRSRPGGAPQLVAGASGVQARWVRVTATVVNDSLPIQQIVAAGTLAPRPANAPPFTGDFWAFGNALNGGGGILRKPAGDDPDHVEVTLVGAGVNAMQCSSSAFVQAFPGTIDGRTWTYVSEADQDDVPRRFVVNDEGTLIVGKDGGGGIRAFGRAAGVALPAYCAPETRGAGTRTVLVLTSQHWDLIYPFDDPETLANFKTLRFSIAGAALLTPSLLTGADIVLFEGVCRPQSLLNAQQASALMDWVAAGHELMLADADMCSDADHPTRYDFLPYKFVSDNPGARGAHGHDLVIVENDTLGTANTNDSPHFVDAEGYASDINNELGDANTVVTQDDHWCGHLFGTNANGVNGFMQMYALHGKGLIIFDGLDKDDAGLSQYQTIRRLEDEQPVPPALPCSRRVSAGFVIVSDQSRAFVPGKPATITVPMKVLSNRGWKGRVTLAAAGDFPAKVTPAAIDLPPAEGILSVAIDVPATAKAGHYSVVVKGAGGGKESDAKISLDSAAAVDTLRSVLDRSCKVDVYGVNFDFNKTTLRPDAEPVLQQILAMFKDDPSLAAEIGGHTDNIGKPAYNLTLSSGRADAVKAWLIAHGIAASRLTTRGYGDTTPLVPNDSDANRARNRRVELKKGNCKP